MRRFLWRTFTVLAAISAARLVLGVLLWAYFFWSGQGWFALRASTPLRTLSPFIISSVLPAAWLILRARRQRERQSRGFEPIAPAERREFSK